MNIDESGFLAYKTYLAINQHFTSDYDYFQYNGGVRAGISAFMKNKDRFFFQKLEYGRTKREIEIYLASAWKLKRERFWIRDLFKPEYERNYHSTLVSIDNLRADFNMHFMELLEKYSFRQLVQEGRPYPIALKLAINKDMPLEVYCAFAGCLGLPKFYANVVQDPVLYPAFAKFVGNYSPFLNINYGDIRSDLESLIRRSSETRTKTIDQ